MEHLSCRLILAADSPASLENPLLKRTVDTFETAEVYFDEGLENAEPVARRMYVAPDLLPLLVAVDEQGCGIYACSGYHVGSVGLALKLLEIGNLKFGCKIRQAVWKMVKESSGSLADYIQVYIFFTVRKYFFPIFFGSIPGKYQSLHSKSLPEALARV